MATLPEIPRVTADPYTGEVPPRSNFRSVHAFEVVAGYLMLHDGEVLQVVSVRPFHGNKLDIHAAPVNGGRIQPYTVMSEQYVEVYPL